MKIQIRASSPYRALTGHKAEILLRDIAQAGQPVKLRVVGLNAAVSTTGIIPNDPTFKKALNECGINI